MEIKRVVDYKWAVPKKLYRVWESLLDNLQSVFLLAVRLYWGWSFFQTGLGKFNNWDRTIGYFDSLGIPFPAVNTFAAASTELLGGICLLLGLGVRLIGVPLSVTMLVAYATAHQTELFGILEDTDAFTAAPPFLFLYASLLVLIFGPGKYSVDHVIAKLARR